MTDPSVLLVGTDGVGDSLSDRFEVVVAEWTEVPPATETADCVVAVHDPPESDALALLERVRAGGSGVPFVVVAEGPSAAPRAVNLGADRYVTVEGGDATPEATAAVEELVATGDTGSGRERSRSEEVEVSRGDGTDRSRSEEVEVSRDDGNERSRSDAPKRSRGDDRKRPRSPGRPRWAGRAVEALDRPFAAVDRDLVYRVANDAYRDRYGVDRAVGRSVGDPPGEAAGELRPYLERALSGEAVSVGPEDNGLGTEIEVRCHPVRADGDVVGAAVELDDVADRRWAERRFGTFFENMPTAGFVLDGEGITRRVNETFCERTGYDREEVVGKPLEELPGILPEADRERTIERFEKLSEGETLPPVTVEYHTRDGDRRYAYVESVPLMRDGEFERLIGISRDVTELKRRERDLARQNERLERFASIVSHDLRNPLEVARGSVEMARRTDDPGEYLDRIESATDRMNEIVDDVLTMAREGSAVEETHPVSLSTLAEDCWELVETRAATLELEDDPTVLADPSRLRELVENLYRNAVEHAGPETTVRVGATEDGFFVADDGPGIDPAEREEVFEPGYTTARGTGLGLNVVRQVATAHDWTVEVTDSRSGGARFEFAGVDRA